jgi:hypothetical protein
MKRALAAVALSVLAVACGGDAAGGPAKSPPSDAPATGAAPAAETPEAAPAEASGDASGEKPAAKTGGDGEDGAWAGESEAKSAKAADAGGKQETRTMEVIASVVKENRKPVRECFEKAKKDLPDLKGDMVIHFVVDPEGKVKKAELNQERSTLKAPPVVDCAVKVVLGIKFPPSSRGMDTTVNYPFNLN